MPLNPLLSLDLLFVSVIGWIYCIRCTVQEDPIEEGLHKVINTMRRAYAVNPNLDFEVFIPKVSFFFSFLCLSIRQSFLLRSIFCFVLFNFCFVLFSAVAFFCFGLFSVLIWSLPVFCFDLILFCSLFLFLIYRVFLFFFLAPSRFSTGGWRPIFDGRPEGWLLARSAGIPKQGCFAPQSRDSDHILSH